MFLLNWALQYSTEIALQCSQPSQPRFGENTKHNFFLLTKLAKHCANCCTFDYSFQIGVTVKKIIAMEYLMF